MHVKVNRPNNLNIIVNNYYIIAVYSVDRTQYSLKIFLYIFCHCRFQVMKKVKMMMIDNTYYTIFLTHFKSFAVQYGNMETLV